MLCLTWPHQEIHIWEINLIQPSTTIYSLQQYLHNDEQERAARFHFEHDRRRFIVTRGALRRILASYGYCDPSDIQFIYGRYGKPAITLPTSLNQLQFNISHSSELALAALIIGRSIGIDIEYVRQVDDLHSLAKHFFAPLEQAALFGLIIEEQHGAFFRCWSRKEAYMKARGEGLALALNSFSVCLTKTCENALLHGADNDTEQWTLQPLNCWFGYEAALAIGRPMLPIRHRYFSME